MFCCGVLVVRAVSVQSRGICTCIIHSFIYKLSGVHLECLWRLQLCLGDRKMAFRQGVFQVIKDAVSSAARRDAVA